MCRYIILSAFFRDQQVYISAATIMISVKMNESGTGTMLEDVSVINDIEVYEESASAWSWLTWVGIILGFIVVYAGVYFIVSMHRVKKKQV